MAGGGFLWQRDFCLLYCKAAVLLETAGQQRDPYREGRNHEKQSGQYPGAGGAFRGCKVLQDAELEELLKWRLYLAVMDVVRKCYKRRDTENFRCYYQKLKQIGTVRTFGESGTEKIRRLVWSVLFRLRVL